MRNYRKPALLVWGVLLALFSALFVYAAMVPPPAKVPGPFDPGRFMAAEESDIRAGLSDPESARFRNDAVSSLHKVAVVCGEINVRNSTNGYVGFRRFVSGHVGDDLMARFAVRQFEDESDPDEMSRLWIVLCGRAQ